MEIVQELLQINQVNPFIDQMIDYCAGNPRYLEYVLVAISSPPESLRQNIKSMQADLDVALAKNSYEFNEEEMSDILTQVC